MWLTVAYFEVATAQNSPFITASSPSSGYSDPRENRRADGTRVGITELQLTFSAPVESALGGALTPANFHLSFYRDGQEITNADIESRQSPTVTAVTGTGAGPYTLTLSQRIPLQAYTVVQARNITDTAKNPLLPANGRTRVVYSNLPMNVNQDSIVTGADINTFLLELNNAKNPLLIDMNRDGVIVGNDISRAVQLLNGVNALKPWKNFDIGAHPESFLCTGNQPPVPSLATPAESSPGQPVSFDATATTDTTGVVVAYTWEFGDGTKGAGPTPSHTYSSPGNYTARVTVTDSCGASATKTVTVNILGEVVATFDFSPENPRINEPVTFTAHQPEADNIWHEWSFSDGYGSYSRSFTHSFAVGGDYGVRLRVYQKLSGTWVLAASSSWVSFRVIAQTLTRIKIVEGDIGENLGVGVVNNTVWSLGRSKLVTVDVSDITSLDFGKVITTSDQFRLRATALAVSDQVVAVGAGTQGVYLLDAQRPDNLQPIKHELFYITGPNSTFLATVVSLYIHDNKLIVGLSHGLKVFDISEPTSPRLIAWVDAITAWSLYVHNGKLLVGRQLPQQDRNVGFSIYPLPDTSLTSPIALSELALVGTRYRPQQFAHRDNILVVAENTYISGDVNFYDASNNYERIGTIGGGGSWYRGATVACDLAISALGANAVMAQFFNDRPPEIYSTTPLGPAAYGFYFASDERNLVYAGVANATVVILQCDEG